MLLALVIDYSSSFNTCNVAELSSNRTGGNGVQNTTENEKFTVMYSRSPKKPRVWSFQVVLWSSSAKKCTKINGFFIKSYYFVTFLLPSPM